MPLPTISTLPTPPSRSNAPAVFNVNADAFMGAFPQLVSELNAYAGALPATVTGTDFNGTSVTSLTVATGSQSLTVQTGKNFQIGQSVRIANTATPANYMDGQVTAYTTGTGALVVLVASIGGAGTFTAWTISLLPAGGGAFATLTGTETLTNKTVTTPILSGTASGITAGRLGYTSGALSFGDGTSQRTVATLDGSQTLTNKTIDTAGTNVVKINGNTLAATAGTATLTFPNTTDTMVGRATTDTLTNKTLTAPTINGGTLAGVTLTTPTISSPVVTEMIFAITDAAAFEINPANGSIQTITLGASRTPKATSFTNGQSVTLAINDGTAFTVTWTDTTFGGSGVIWLGGAAPTLATTGWTWVTLWKMSGQVYGSLVGTSA